MYIAPMPRAAMLLLGGVAAAALVAFAAHVGLGVGGANLDWFFNDYLYHALILVAVVSCAVRAALVREERLGWLVMSIALGLWAGRGIYWTAVLSDMDEPPYPSIADGLGFAAYPAAYVALMLLLRARGTAARRSLWLDGGIAALVIAALGAMLVFQPIIDTSSGTTAAVVTNLGYPAGDLTLIALIVAVFGVSGWRPGRAWALLGLGLALMAVADGIYLVQAAKGTYVEGTLLDAFWPAAIMLVGLAAWQSPRKGAVSRTDGLRVVVVPIASALVGLGLLILDQSLNIVAVALAKAAVLLVIVRMGIAFAENQRMLSHSRHEALTDALTGLRNRRGLMRDLDAELRAAAPESPVALVLCDLNGFKQYNDTFGHPAGDALLTRLGESLKAAVGSAGSAYRLGGDEFCVLAPCDEADVDSLVRTTTVALSEEGRGFSVSAAHGVVLVPAEAREPAEALQIADRRMYQEKSGGRISAGSQSRDVLLRALRERRIHDDDERAPVAQLAVKVGRALELPAERVDELERAAELYDIGKLAIPDAILEKPGPLDDDEWSFMRRHSGIAERILLAAPALAPLTPIVRSSSERWDGSGYPDQLRGEDIPLGARIIAVCAAFNAMTAGRPYRDPMAGDDALTELTSCAGTQFDPDVVAAFVGVLAPSPPRPDRRLANHASVTRPPRRPRTAVAGPEA